MKRLAQRIAVSACVGVVVIALDYPAVIVQTFVLILHPGAVNAALWAGALILSLDGRYLGSGGYLGRFCMWARMFLIENRTRFERVPLNAYEHMLPEHYREALKRPFSMLANPRQLVVCVAEGAADDVPLGIVSYPSLSGSALVIVPDHPQKFTTFQKFAFLREVDHVATPSVVLDREAQKMVWVLSVLWLALFADWRLWNAAALILIFFAYEVLHVSSQFGPESPSDAIIRQQLKADHSALDSLSDEEAARLDAILAEYPLTDPEASDEEESNPQSAVLQAFLPKYTTGLDLSNSFRTYVVRCSIAVKQGLQDAQQRLSAAALVIFEGVRFLFAMGSGFAVASVGQRVAGWRLWTGGIFVLLMSLNVALSWRYIRRSRKIIQERIAECGR